MAIDHQDPNANPAAPSKVRVAQRRVMALELRRQGASYRKIARQLSQTEGISPKYTERQAYRDVMAAMAQLAKRQAELAEENRRLDLDRLDELFIKVFEAGKKGDIMSINAALQILDRRARLLGYDRPPVRSNLSIDVSRLSDSQLQRIANGEDPLLVLATSGES